jgi:hypothetical protein
MTGKVNRGSRVFLDMLSQGFSFSLHEVDKIRVTPANKLTEGMRAALRENRSEIRQAVVEHAVTNGAAFWPMVYDEKTAQALCDEMARVNAERGRLALDGDVVLSVLRRDGQWSEYWHSVDGFCFICDKTDLGYVRGHVAGKSHVDRFVALAKYSIMFLDAYKKSGSIANACCVANAWIRTGEIKGNDCPN